MRQSKVLSMMGLATKARKTASGEFSVEKAVKEGRAYLVVVAEDASDNTKKKFSNMCHFYQVPVYYYGEKAVLGHSMGKEQRSSMAFLDEGFAKSVMKQLEADE